MSFDESNLKVCDPLEELQSQESSHVSPFFIAERGGCTFVKKVRNMENVGVAVGIIYDDKEENPESVIMSDDGSGGGLKIPAMLISRLDGKKLIDFLKTASEEELS